jgi:TRAP-type transport system periplasmic protein
MKSNSGMGEKMKKSNDERTRVTRRTLLKGMGTAIGGAMLSGFPGIISAEEAIKWRYYAYTPPLHQYTKMLKEIAQEVEQKTNKRLQITVFPGGELPYNPTEVFNIVRDRFVEGGEAVADFVAGSVPITNLTNLPMLATNLKELEEAMKVFQPYVQGELDRMGLQILFWDFGSIKAIYGKGKPVEKLSDLKGRRIRAFGAVDSQFVRLLGATPVALPPTEVPQAMQRGVMDAFIASAQFAVGSKWDELTQWGYLLEMSGIAIYETVNRAALQALPQDVSKILTETASAYQKRWNSTVAAMEKTGREAMEKKGIKLVTASAEDQKRARELAAPYWEEWAKSVGPKAVQALQEVRKALGR